MKRLSISILLTLNIFFLLYYSFQLLVFTDEFAMKNLGFFNHAIAGLSEIIGIIFLSLSFGMIFIFFKGIKYQFPLLATIFIMYLSIAINFWRYVFTNSPGESDIQTITINAVYFSLSSLSMIFLLLLRNKYEY